MDMEQQTGVARVAQSVSDVKSVDPGLSAYSFESLGEYVKFADLMARMTAGMADDLAATVDGIVESPERWTGTPYGGRAAIVGGLTGLYTVSPAVVLQGRLDKSNTSWIGHSRGGEGVAHSSVSARQGFAPATRPRDRLHTIL